MNKQLSFLTFFVIIISTLNVENVYSYSTSFAKYEEASINFWDGTSIKGLGKIIIGDKIKFKVDKESKPDIWTDLSLKGITFYGVNEDFVFEYIYVKENKPILVEVIEEGYVTLYTKSTTSWNPVNPLGSNDPPRGMYKETAINIYVKKEDEELATVLNGNFKRRAKKYFTDCEGLLEKLDSKDFNQYTVLEIIYYYNDFCAD